MPGRGKNSSSITDQIDELKSKISLLEGDRKAYYENSQWTMKQNKDQILKMRKEVKILNQRLSNKLSADEQVISDAFKNEDSLRKDKLECRNKPGPEAIDLMDNKVADQKNKLNKLRYRTDQYQKKLEALETQHAQMVKDAEAAADTDAGDSPEAQKLRNLENLLDKSNLKCKEAEHIHRTYCQIKSKLEEEHQTFEPTLDEMEQELQRLREENKEFQQMHNDAVISRDAAQDQLKKEEQEVYSQRKKREVELQKVKKEAEEKKAQYEKIERRQAARGSVSQEELSAEQRQAILGEDDAQQIAEYEEVFKRIKEATGVSDTQEVVLRFENQGDTTEHLEDLKATNEKTIFRLREENEKFHKDFEDMKYSGEAKLSSGERLLEEFQTHLSEEEKRRDQQYEKLEKASKILTNAKSGVEHLSEKLKHLKSASSQVGKSKISPTSDEYVLDQLSICEEKLLKLLEELDSSGKDMTELEKQMMEEEFHNQQETKLPQYNTRVKLPTTSEKEDVFNEDEEDSGEDGEALTREQIKKNSQQLADSKNKRRIPKKKKKGK